MSRIYRVLGFKSKEINAIKKPKLRGEALIRRMEELNDQYFRDGKPESIWKQMTALISENKEQKARNEEFLKEWGEHREKNDDAWKNASKATRNHLDNLEWHENIRKLIESEDKKEEELRNWASTNVRTFCSAIIPWGKLTQVSQSTVGNRLDRQVIEPCVREPLQLENFSRRQGETEPSNLSQHAM
nr:hypothetical protein [Candidatus Njordarchaeota archaeon]